MSNTNTQRDRVVRVFISSTFRDIHAERDEFVLRRAGCDWGQIALLWGIIQDAITTRRGSADLPGRDQTLSDVIHRADGGTVRLDF